MVLYRDGVARQPRVLVPALKAKNRARFTDEAIHDGLVKGESDPVFLQLVEIFGNRLGVVILIFIAWPVPLYLMIFPRKKA